MGRLFLMVYPAVVTGIHLTLRQQIRIFVHRGFSYLCSFIKIDDW